MSDSTIPDALALDLRDLYLSAQPAGMAIAADSVRVKHAEGEPPSERLVILTGDPRNQIRMEGTAKVPVSIQYITSKDRMTPDAHRLNAGKLDEWWRSIRAAKRRGTLSSRVYLHEITNLQPTTAIRAEEREQVTTLRGELMVTLLA